MPEMLEAAAEPLRVLYYGEGGTGKTTHLCHMADLGKVLVINAESGVKTRALQRCGVDTSNIEVFPGEGESLTFKSLEDEWKRIRAELAKDAGSYVGVVWDSLTEIYSVLLEQVTAKEYEKAVRTQSKRAEQGEFFVDRGDYGIMTEQVRQLIRKFRDLPIHLGASALERRDQDDDGKVAYRPSVNPALHKDLYLWFDVVCHTEVIEIGGREQYQGSFRPIGKYRAKDRYKVLPRTLVDPTFDRALAYVEEATDMENDPVMKDAIKWANEHRDKHDTEDE